MKLLIYQNELKQKTIKIFYLFLIFLSILTFKQMINKNIPLVIILALIFTAQTLKWQVNPVNSKLQD